jgi:putative MATE family efflux protein
MKDLTKGNPFKLILLFALPVFAGNVFQQLYNMADTVIVGNTISAAAFTGVGLTGPVSFLVLGFVFGLTGGFSVRIAQRFGAGDDAGMRRATAMSFTLCIILSVVITAIAVPLTGPLLRLMKTPEEYFSYAYSYLFTIFCGIGATVLYNMAAGVLRAIGDSKTPLVFLIVAALLNVVLDFAFIVGCRLYYVGAGLATVVSQLLSGAACLAYMMKRYPQLRLSRADWKWDTRLAGGHVAVGLPMALQFSITAIGCIVQQTALNGLSDSLPGAVTAYVAASKIDNIATQSFPALGAAIATYAGQNHGAGEDARVRKGATAGMVYVLAGAALGVAFCQGLYDPLMRLFIDTDKGGVSIDLAAVLGYGRKYLLCQNAGYVGLGAIFIYRSALQGIGKSAITMFSGVTELGARVLTSFVFVNVWGYIGFCLSNVTAWVAADIFLLITYFAVMHFAKIRERKQKEKSDETPFSAAA